MRGGQNTNINMSVEKSFPGDSKRFKISIEIVNEDV